MGCQVVKGAIVINVERRGDWDVVRYRGPVNEDTALHLPILKSLHHQVIFNFKDVKAINSSGIRTWVLFLRKFTPGRKVAYEECPPTVVTQLNMIPGFHEGVDILSVIAPFTCPTCNRQESELYEASRFPKTNDDLEGKRCPKCGDTMTLGETVEEYFEFASRRENPAFSSAP
jgi:hypothetical protein